MSTDQIQSKLYQRSDKETEARVKAACQPLQAFVGANLAQQHSVHVPTSLGRFFFHGGEKLTTETDAATIRSAIIAGNVRVVVPVSELLAAVQNALKETLKSEDRKRYVEQFLQDVENLKTQANELSARLDDVENQ